MRHDLERTRAAHLRATSQLNAILAEVPSGLPAADGRFVIENTAKVTRAAFERYTEARDALDHFIRKHHRGNS